MEFFNVSSPHVRKTIVQIPIETHPENGDQIFQLDFYILKIFYNINSKAYVTFSYRSNKNLKKDDADGNSKLATSSVIISS